MLACHRYVALCICSLPLTTPRAVDLHVRVLLTFENLCPPALLEPESE